jgi:hypothetical protein
MGSKTLKNKNYFAKPFTVSTTCLRQIQVVFRRIRRNLVVLLIGFMAFPGFVFAQKTKSAVVKTPAPKAVPPKA